MKAVRCQIEGIEPSPVSTHLLLFAPLPNQLWLFHVCALSHNHLCATVCNKVAITSAYIRVALKLWWPCVLSYKSTGIHHVDMEVSALCLTSSTTHTLVFSLSKACIHCSGPLCGDWGMAKDGDVCMGCRSLWERSLDAYRISLLYMMRKPDIPDIPCVATSYKNRSQYFGALRQKCRAGFGHSVMTSLKDFKVSYETVEL